MEVTKLGRQVAQTWDSLDDDVYLLLPVSTSTGDFQAIQKARISTAMATCDFFEPYRGWSSTASPI